MKSEMLERAVSHVEKAATMIRGVDTSAKPIDGIRALVSARIRLSAALILIENLTEELRGELPSRVQVEDTGERQLEIGRPS